MSGRDLEQHREYMREWRAKRREGKLLTELPKEWEGLPEHVEAWVEGEWVHANCWSMTKRMPDGEMRIDFSRALSRAPSMGAINLLQVAVEDRRVFESMIRPKLLAMQKEVSNERVKEKRERKKIEEIEEILKQFDEVV